MGVPKAEMQIYVDWMREKGFDFGPTNLEGAMSINCSLDKRIFPLLLLLCQLNFETTSSCSGHKCRHCKGVGNLEDSINGYIDFRIRLDAPSIASLAYLIKRKYHIDYEDKFWKDMEHSEKVQIGIGLVKFPSNDLKLFRISWGFNTERELKKWLDYFGECLCEMVEGKFRKNRIHHFPQGTTKNGMVKTFISKETI